MAKSAILERFGPPKVPVAISAPHVWLAGGRKSENIHARSGVIRGIPAYFPWHDAPCDSRAYAPHSMRA